MIKRYQTGIPLKTDAVVTQLPIEAGDVPFVTYKDQVITYHMDDSVCIYGLGENLRGINKRGYRYTSNNTDDPNHTEDKISLYGSHNFIVIDGNKESFGLFIDNPGTISYDIGYTHADEMVIRMRDLDTDLYVITKEEGAESALNSIIAQFRQLIGQSYIPPRFAFGFGQCRWGYKTEEDIRAVVEGHEKNQFPIDMVYMDIDYMDHYKDFTIDKERFPDFKKLCDDMKEKGIHLVPIIDAGIKAEEGYPLDEEGLEKDYYCKMADGSVFEAAVWPGLAHFPDFLRPEVREWFGMSYKALTELGIDAFWNDMNEPALFYTKAGLERMWKDIKRFEGDENMVVDKVWALQWAVNSLANNAQDYASFYHELDGQTVCHNRVHNLYGYNMTRAASDALKTLRPDVRTLLFSRSSYIGMHRYGGIWTGDNKAWWSHLLLNVKMMPSLNMCGFLYSGADLGGFGADTTEELSMRWLALGLFTPLMRNHAAMGTRDKEYYRFDRLKDFANLLGIRYGLLPYLYSEYVKAALRGGMYFRTMVMEYPKDSFASQVEDQLFVGESLMIAPVYEQNAKGRYVYLPEKMKLLRMRSITDYEEEVLEAGHHYVKAACHEVLVFIRPGHLLPVSLKAAKNTEEVEYENVTVWSFEAEGATYEYFHDDGVSVDYESEKNWTMLSV